MREERAAPVNDNDSIEPKFYDDRDIIFSKAKTYQQVSIDNVVSESNRAKGGVVILSILLAITVIALVIIASNKTVIPVLVTVNTTTGQVEIFENVSDQTIKNTDAKEALQKYWINKFIVCSETYDWNDANRLYACVERVSGKKVFSKYAKRFDTSHKDNWIHLYKYEKTKISAKVTSINKLPPDKKDDANNGMDRWSVGFTRTEDKSKEEPIPVYYKAIITTVFEEVSRNEEQVRENPLNFRVVSFRKDRETPPNI